MCSDEPIKMDSFEKIYAWIDEKYKHIDKINALMPYGNRYKLFFRGESNNTYELVPSIYRNGRIINEHKFYYEALNKCPESFKDCNTTFERLAKMQHYGIPTRLLDITENPLIALHFAVEKKQEHNDGKLYCFYVSEKAIKYPDDSNTAMLANVATLDGEQFYDGKFFQKAGEYSKKFKAFAKEKDTGKRRALYEESFSISKSNPVIEELFLKSARDTGYYPTDFSFSDIAQIICVKPKVNNRRISNQNSAFLLFGFLLDKNYVLPLSTLDRCLKLFNLLFSKIGDEESRNLENSIIKTLPIEQDKLDDIIKCDPDFRLLFFASERKSKLAFEINYKKSEIVYNLISEYQNARLNAHSSLSLGRHFKDIKEKLSDFLFLDYFHNFLYRNCPLLCFDSVDITNESKDDISCSLNRMGITDDYIYPELYSINTVLCKKFDHRKPLVVEKIGDKLVVTHLSKFVKEHCDLQVGDFILKKNNLDDICNEFFKSETIELKTVRIKESSGIKYGDNNFYKICFDKDIEYDDNTFENKLIKINFKEISSFNEPLFPLYGETEF